MKQIFKLIILLFFVCCLMTKGSFAESPAINSVITKTISITGENFDSTCRVFISGGDDSVMGSINIGRYASGVYVSGDYAYLAKGSSGLDVIDISNSAKPKVMDSAHITGNIYGIYVSGNYAYVADHFSGLIVIDISDAGNPRIAGNIAAPGYAYSVYVSGSYIYMTGNSGLRIIHKLSAGTACEPVNISSNIITAIVPMGLMPGN